MKQTFTTVTGECLSHSGQLSFSLRCQICNNTLHTCLPMALMCFCVCVPCVFTTRSALLIPGRINNGSRTVAPLTVFLSSVSPAGYPCALVYRRFLFYQPATVIHLFHTFSGLALAAFNFGKMKREIKGLCYYAAVCV